MKLPKNKKTSGLGVTRGAIKPYFVAVLSSRFLRHDFIRSRVRQYLNRFLYRRQALGFF